MVARFALVLTLVLLDSAALVAGRAFVRSAEGTAEVAEEALVPLAAVSASAPGVERRGALLLRDGAPFTGRLVEISAHGRTETDYVDGRRHGDQRAWYPDGSPREHRIYRQGRREGLHFGWWPNGARRFAARFLDGLAEGATLRWYASGQLAQESTYEAGQEAGRQRMWTPSGDLRANYVVADGRRYGLIGTKPCSTP